MFPWIALKSRRASGLVLAMFGFLPGEENPFFDETHLPQIQLIFPMDDWLKLLSEYYSNGNVNYVPADLIVDGVLYPNVGVQHKGDASYQWGTTPRENMKITLDAFVPGQEAFGCDVITVDAGRQSSVFTEVAALWILRDFERTPLANLAHVVAGTASKPKDLGVFTNTERIDKRFFKSRFGGEGHRYEPRLTVEAFTYLGDGLKRYRENYRWEGGDEPTSYDDLRIASIALQNSPDNQVRAQVGHLIDVDVCLRNLIGSRMIGNFDSVLQGNNYYLCEDSLAQGRFVPVAWDLDLGWEDEHPDPIPDESDIPLAKIFQAPEEMERSFTYVRHYLQRGFARGWIDQRLQALKALALPWILGSPYEDLKTEADVDAALDYMLVPMSNLRNLLEAQFDFKRELPQITELVHSPDAPIEGDDVWVSARVFLATSPIDEVLLWSRECEPFHSQPMFDDGLHHDGAAGDKVFGAALPAVPGGATIEYYVEVRPVNLLFAGYGFEPMETEFRPRSVSVDLITRGPVRLNEILADNEDGDQDEAGDRDDWLEIVNLDVNDFDLSGHFLSDDAQNPYEWRIPDGTILAAGGHLRIWADDEPLEGPLHASFSLSKDGEALYLSGDDSRCRRLLDEVAFGNQEEDLSFARVHDGGDHWFYVERPTGGAPLVSAGSWNAYNARQSGSSYGLKLSLSGTLAVGGTLQLDVSGGTPGGLALLLLGSAAASLDAGKLGVLCVDPTTTFWIPVLLNGNGEGHLQAQVPPGFGNVTFYSQVLDRDLSNALIAQIAP